ncbi:MAG: DUF3618 domain-containing protein [Streptosporangiales bacterium]
MTAAEGNAANAAGEAAANAAGAAQAPADDPQALMAEIERTREELGHTVEALAAKVDVKARAQERAAEVSDQVRSRLAGVKEDLAGKVGQVTTGLTGKAAQTRQAVSGNGRTVLGAGQPAARQVTGRAAQAGSAAWKAAPEPVRQTARRAVAAVDQHRVEAAAITGAVLLAGWLAVRWIRR